MEASPELDRTNTETTVSNDHAVELQHMAKLLEESKQEAYELRTRLQVSQRCALDLESEVEAYQQEVIEREKLHEAAIRDIQEEKLSVLKDAEDKNANLEADYQILSDKCKKLEKELQAKDDKADLLKYKNGEGLFLQQELKDALDTLSAANEACNQHKELISVLQDEKHGLTERVSHLEEDLDLHKEYLSVSKAQLVDVTGQFKEVQEELAIAQSELSALKSAPADMMARGNSLFAEVEDNRQKILKQYRAVAGKYNHVKGDYSSKCAQLRRLRMETTRLQSKMETAEREAKKHYNAYVGNYEIRIQELQKTIKDLKNDVKPVYLNGDREIMIFAEKTVENSRKEVLSLRNEMEWRSALRLNEAAELLKTRGELREARMELRQAFARVKKLKELLEHHGITDTSAAVLGEVSARNDKARQATISDLINAVMGPWEQADQKSLEKSPNSILKEQERLEAVNSSRKDGSARYTTIEEKSGLKSNSVKNEQCVSSGEELALQAVQKPQQYASLEEELALNSEIESAQEVNTSAPSTNKDELRPSENQSERTEHMLHRSPDKVLTLEEELALETNQLCVKETGSGCKTDFIKDSRCETKESPDTKDKRTDGMSSSDRGSLHPSHEIQSVTSICSSASKFASPDRVLKGMRDAVPLSSTPEGGGDVTLETPRSILKNRNVYTEEAAPLKGVRFEKNMEPGNENVKTEKENAVESSENDSNFEKLKKRFKRPPSKKVYPIYYINA